MKNRSLSTEEKNFLDTLDAISLTIESLYLELRDVEGLYGKDSKEYSKCFGYLTLSLETEKEMLDSINWDYEGYYSAISYLIENESARAINRLMYLDDHIKKVASHLKGGRNFSYLNLKVDYFFRFQQFNIVMDMIEKDLETTKDPMERERILYTKYSILCASPFDSSLFLGENSIESLGCSSDSFLATYFGVGDPFFQEARKKFCLEGCSCWGNKYLAEDDPLEKLEMEYFFRASLGMMSAEKFDEFTKKFYQLPSDFNLKNHLCDIVSKAISDRKEKQANEGLSKRKLF